MFKRLLYTHDWILTSMMFLILAIGLMTLYSTSIGIAGSSDFQRQMIFAITGIGIYFGISFFDYSYLQYKPVVITIYIIDVFLLILGALAGRTAGGATRWLAVGALNIQPSEITKGVIIIALSSFLVYTKQFGYKRLLYAACIALPLICLVFIEPSLSASLVILVIAGSIYFFSGEEQIKNVLLIICILLAINIGGEFFMPHFLLPTVRGMSIGFLLLSLFCIGGFSRVLSLKTVLIALCIGLIIGIGTKDVLWNKVLKPYQKQRITAFINPAEESNIGAFQVNQSKIAIGSGELLGKGFAQGTQSRLDFLPDHDTDFIFASFSEEFGLIGDSVLLALFGLFLFSIMSIADKTTDPFGFYLLCGIIALFIFQTFANIGINTGLLPSTGIPMPLVSYGGSSLWVTCALLGLVQSIYRSTKKKRWQSIEL